MNFWTNVYNFFVDSLTFIPKYKIENILAIKLTNNIYSIFCIIIWAAIIFVGIIIFKIILNIIIKIIKKIIFNKKVKPSKKN